MGIVINIKESFPLLAKAPIVEAVIDIRARAETTWEEGAIAAKLKPNLPDYPEVQSQREYQQEFKIAPGVSPEATTLDLGWKGLRFDSQDKRHIAQFNRNGFVFSRLSPYEDWTQLESEALRLWKMYERAATPTLIQRIGVRFINRIELPRGEMEFEKYLTERPRSPATLELPFTGFLHHDALVVPGYPYAINIIKALQQPVSAEKESFSLILDIDVYTVVESLPVAAEKITDRLAEMRWLKNKVFYGSVTEHALEGFK